MGDVAIVQHFFERSLLEQHREHIGLEDRKKQNITMNWQDIFSVFILKVKDVVIGEKIESNSKFQLIIAKCICILKRTLGSSFKAINTYL